MDPDDNGVLHEEAGDESLIATDDAEVHMNGDADPAELEPLEAYADQTPQPASPTADFGSPQNGGIDAVTEQALTSSEDAVELAEHLEEAAAHEGQDAVHYDEVIAWVRSHVVLPGYDSDQHWLEHHDEVRSREARM
jgi:hypothetical protein